MIHFWDEEDYKELGAADTFASLVPIALRVAGRMTPPIAMVSGPVSTGGRGSIEANLHMLSAAVDLAYEKGHNIFDQNPFEEKLQELKKQCVHADGYCQELLEQFYRPIFESGVIKKMYFLPAWTTSTGARWERVQCERLSIEILDYPAEWFKELEQ